MTDEAPRHLRVVLWGTYDTGKPRIRLIRAALAAAGIEVIETHADVWGGVEDKSQLSGFAPRLWRLMRWMFAYPGLLWRYFRAPPHDAVLVGYLGQLDVQMIAWAARRRGVPVLWDAFLSLYDTVVGDRALIGPGHPGARFLKWIEGRACRKADRVILDTDAHAALFRALYDVPPEKTAGIMVGAESAAFQPIAPADWPPKGRVSILFYGQFIPLHGISTIVAAARLARDRALDWDWVLIGEGQEAGAIAASLEADPVPALRWVPWVPYGDLLHEIHAADICLGIFGTSEKAGRVIPNKAFQILLSGQPLVTRESPAIRELTMGDAPGVRLVAPGDPEALLGGIEALLAADVTPGPDLHAGLTARFSEAALGADWRAEIERAITDRRMNEG